MVAYLLSLIEDFDFRLGRRDLHVWSPTPLKVFSCKSFLRILLDPSSVVESVLGVLWRIRTPKKVKFFSGKFCLVVSKRWFGG